MVAHLARFVNILIVHTVVGYHHDEQIAPIGSSFKLAHKLTDTIVEIREGILLLIIVLLNGHIPRFMTTQGRIAHEEMPGGIGGANLVKKGFKGDIIAHTPLGGALLFRGIISLPMQLFPTCSYQVAAHVGKVDVATIEIACGIALFLQGLCDRG